MQKITRESILKDIADITERIEETNNKMINLPIPKTLREKRDIKKKFGKLMHDRDHLKSIVDMARDALEDL